MAVGLHLVGTCVELDAELSRDPTAKWLDVSGKGCNPTTLNDVNARYQARKLEGLSGGSQWDLASDVTELFDAAAKFDPEGFFPSSSGIPLGVARWNDVEALLRAHRLSGDIRSPLLVLIEKGPVTPTAGALAGLLNTAVSLFSLPALKRIARSSARRLLSGRILGELLGRDCWVTVGGFLADTENDTYFARWPWVASVAPLRVYQQSGN